MHLSSRPKADGREVGQPRQGQRRAEADAGAEEGQNDQEVEGGHLGRRQCRRLQVGQLPLRIFLECNFPFFVWLKLD